MALLDAPLFAHKEPSLFSNISQCFVCPRDPPRRRAFTAYKNQEPVAFTITLFSSSLTQFTNHPTLPTPTATSKAGLLKPTHPVDTQPLQTKTSACTISLGAIRNMSGNANTGAGQQPSFNTRASMSSVNSSVTSNTSPNLQGLSQNISLGSAGPISLVLSTPAQAPSSNLVPSTTNSTAQTGLTAPVVPMSPTPPHTPEIKGMTNASPMPALDLDQSSTSGSNTTLITTSPYTQNESVTFAVGTAFWQPSTAPTAAAAASNPNAPACNVASSAPTSQRPMTAPLPASNIIAASPYAQNEGVTFSAQTSLWTSSSASTSAPAASQTPTSPGTSIIMASPYTQNEGVTFPPGTQMGQPQQ
jgi:hypothetical protein